MEQPRTETEHSGQTKVQEPEPGSKPNPEDSRHVADGQGNEAAPVTGSESDSQVQGEQSTSSGTTKKSVRWNPELVTESTYLPSPQARPVLSYPSSSVRETFYTVRNAFGRWRKTVGEASRKAENLAGNTWQHLKTSPSFSEAAIGRIAQGTKVLVEGGYDKIFRLTFETVPGEELQNCYACYLSTSAGPVMGVLYISTAKVAYSSDNPLSYKADDQTEWSYYKVVIPLDQLKAVNSSSSHDNPSEKYIQLISSDGQEFWFMGFLYYEGAVSCLQEACQAYKTQAA